MKHFVLTVLCAALILPGFAQFPMGGAPGGNRGGAPGGGQANIGHFYGRIVDSKTNKGIEGASVELFNNKFDPKTKNRKDTLQGVMITSRAGDFSLENLPLFGQYTLKISAIGYAPINQKVAFQLKMGGGGQQPGQQGDMSQALNMIDKDLGNIKMEQDAKTLEAVTVTGSKPMIQMGIDRKIFNVDKNIAAAGGSGVDVMRQVPLVNVDIDGNVTLRNSAPTIFVDGRPTTLTLDQIPAEAIESIEIITNPSAKYDASGGQSGIINVVLKKNRKAGYNGNLRAGIDSRGKFSGGGDINVKQGKINFFANAMYNQRKSKSWGETDRMSSIQDTSVSTIQTNNSIFDGAFAFARFGFDFLIDNRNTITLSTNIVNGTFHFNTNTSSAVDSLLSPPSFESQYRNTIGTAMFQNNGYQLSYKHNFAKAGKEWTGDLNYNQSTNTNTQDIRFRSFYDPAQTNPKFPEQLQGVGAGGHNKFFTAQTDYVNPITENIKIEVGARAQFRTFNSFQNNSFNGILQPDLSNTYTYTDHVYAGYATFSEKIKDKWSYQLGLRAESSGYDGEQVGKPKYTNSFPVSLFPSAFITRSFKDKQDLQLNYTRRINRPNFFQLMPNTDYSDPLNYQTGNPDLKPEFTHSLELSYQKTYGKRSNTFLATVFGKYTTNLIARYQSWQELGTSGDSAFVATYINANTAYAAGLELIFRNNFTKWWEMTLNTNVYYSKINGSNVVAGLENERTSWFAKWNNTFKINKGWSIQLSGDYNSKSALPVSTAASATGGGGGRGGGGGGFGPGTPSTTQGYIDANYGVDMGLRKEIPIKKNSLIISANWSDIFRTRKYQVHSVAAGFIQDDWRRRDPQMVRVNISYRFGKFDISLFKRKNMKGEAEGMQNGMQGMQQ